MDKRVASGEPLTATPTITTGETGSKSCAQAPAQDEVAWSTAPPLSIKSSTDEQSRPQDSPPRPAESESRAEQAGDAPSGDPRTAARGQPSAFAQAPVRLGAGCDIVHFLASRAPPSWDHSTPASPSLALSLFPSTTCSGSTHTLWLDPFLSSCINHCSGPWDLELTGCNNKSHLTESEAGPRTKRRCRGAGRRPPPGSRSRTRALQASRAPGSSPHSFPPPPPCPLFRDKPVRLGFRQAGR